MYAILKENRAIADLCRADRAMMADIHTRLEETFALTAEHKVRPDCYVHFTATDYYVSKLNICLVAGELVLDPNRVRYTTLSVDVEVSILLLVCILIQISSWKLHLDQDPQEAKGALLLQYSIFGNLARQELLDSTIRCTCSSVQNSYREMVSANLIS